MKSKNKFAKNITESTEFQIAQKDEKKKVDLKFLRDDLSYTRDYWGIKNSVKPIDFAARFGRRI